MTPDTRHVTSDDDLIRYLDAALSAPEADAITKHVETCDRCRTRMERIVSRRRALHNLFEATDAPTSSQLIWPPASTAARWNRRALQRRGWVVAAAIVIGMGGVLAAVTPVRAWVLARIDDAMAAVGIGAEPRPPAPPEPPATPPATAEVAFEPTEPELTVVLETLQDAGRLDIAYGSGRDATLSISSGTTETVIVLEDALRVTNHQRSRASYRLTLPQSVTAVTVRIGGRRHRFAREPGADTTWFVDLEKSSGG